MVDARAAMRRHLGVLDELEPIAGLHASASFFESVRVEGKSISDKTDALLFQAGSGGPPERRHTSISVVRQLYAGAGKSQQLTVEWSYDPAILDLDARKISMWSHRYPSIAEFLAAAKEALAKLATIPPPRAVEFRVDRF